MSQPRSGKSWATNSEPLQGPRRRPEESASNRSRAGPDGGASPKARQGAYRQFGDERRDHADLDSHPGPRRERAARAGATAPALLVPEPRATDPGSRRRVILPVGEPALRRGCEVCGSGEFDEIYRQRFAAFDDSSAFTGYDVVACAECGFAYADGIPAQSVFERYYSEMSKYELRDDAEPVSPSAAANYRAIVAEIAQRLPDRSSRILDVGSGAGHLLAAFREAGFEELRGFDPSTRCAEYARSVYGIDVVNHSISQMARADEEYDLILLSSVLEHLRDLVPTLYSLVDLLAPGGAFWFEVPDTARFADAVGVPFQQFSLEHINYFTQTSLTSLLARVGLVPLDLWPAVRRLGEIDDDALDGIFRHTVAAPGPPAKDEIGPAALRRYVTASSAVEERLIASLARFARAGNPIVIWGTGGLTLHLLSNERLELPPIQAFVDSNENYQGKRIRGIPVLAPESLSDPEPAVVIGSRVYESEIAAEIRERYRLKNPVVRLFADAAGSG